MGAVPDTRMTCRRSGPVPDGVRPGAEVRVFGGARDVLAEVPRVDAADEDGDDVRGRCLRAEVGKRIFEAVPAPERIQRHDSVAFGREALHGFEIVVDRRRRRRFDGPAEEGVSRSREIRGRKILPDAVGEGLVRHRSGGAGEVEAHRVFVLRPVRASRHVAGGVGGDAGRRPSEEREARSRRGRGEGDCGPLAVGGGVGVRRATKVRVVDREGRFLALALDALAPDVILDADGLDPIPVGQVLGAGCVQIRAGAVVGDCGDLRRLGAVGGRAAEHAQLRRPRQVRPFQGHAPERRRRDREPRSKRREEGLVGARRRHGNGERVLRRGPAARQDPVVERVAGFGHCLERDLRIPFVGSAARHGAAAPAGRRRDGDELPRGLRERVGLARNDDLARPLPARVVVGVGEEDLSVARARVVAAYDGDPGLGGDGVPHAVDVERDLDLPGAGVAVHPRSDRIDGEVVGPLRHVDDLRADRDQARPDLAVPDVGRDDEPHGPVPLPGPALIDDDPRVVRGDRRPRHVGIGRDRDGVVRVLSRGLAVGVEDVRLVGDGDAPAFLAHAELVVCDADRGAARLHGRIGRRRERDAGGSRRRGGRHGEPRGKVGHAPFHDAPRVDADGQRLAGRLELVFRHRERGDRGLLRDVEALRRHGAVRGRDGDRPGARRKRRIGLHLVDDASAAGAGVVALVELDPFGGRRRGPAEVRRGRDGEALASRAVHAESPDLGRGDLEDQRRPPQLRHDERLGADRHRAGAGVVALVFRDRDLHFVAAQADPGVRYGQPVRVHGHGPCGVRQRVNADLDRSREVVGRRAGGAQPHPSAGLEDGERVVGDRQGPVARRDLVVGSDSEGARARTRPRFGGDRDPIRVGLRVPRLARGRVHPDAPASAFAFERGRVAVERGAEAGLRDRVDIAAHVDVAHAGLDAVVGAHRVADGIARRATGAREQDPVGGRRRPPRAAAGGVDRRRAAGLLHRARHRRDGDHRILRRRRIRGGATNGREEHKGRNRLFHLTGPPS